MMRAILITATTMLGLSLSGAVAQDEMMSGGISLSGSAGLGLTFHGDIDKVDPQTVGGNGANKDVVLKKGVDPAESRSEVNHFVKFVLKGEGVTDGGLTFGASARINTDKVDDAEVYIGGEMWSVNVGAIDPASDMAENLPDVGFDGNIGVDNVAEEATADTAADAGVTLNFGVATVGVSFGFVTPGEDDAAKTETTVGSPARTAAITGDARAAAAARLKQKNEWAVGAKFDAGPVTIGLGVDSGKQGLAFENYDSTADGELAPRYQPNQVDQGNAIQASVSADLGMFSGGIFYAQQKHTQSVTNRGDDDMRVAATDTAPAKTVNNKVTALGASVSVDVIDGTTITAVYTQAKHDNPLYQTGATAASGNTTANNRVVAKTDKGFGAGVTHALGGGATLQAGFGKVKDQTKASVGVVMSF